MKKHAIPVFILALFTVLAFTSCDMINDFIASRTRNIAVIQIYNSNHVKTNKLQPNDTLYVEVQGLKAGGFYKVECLDPLGATITMMTAEADENGVISPSPLWYDVGFKKKTVDIGGTPTVRAVLPSDSELGVRAFNIHVQSLDATSDSTTMTDFKLPFFVVFNTDTGSRPQPIVMAGKKDDSGAFYLENSFKAGEHLWVKVENLDELPLGSTGAKLYIVPFDAAPYGEGTLITNKVLTQAVSVTDLKNGVLVNADPESWFDNVNNNASWDPIPTDAKGRAFSVIVDVNGNGIFEVGTDKYHLDGIDGNGVAGFIVTNDPDPTINYIPANIASGGVTWGHFWFERWPDHDYRDVFNVNCYDTQYGWDWALSGYGVKALWNPYINNDLPQTPNSASVLYWGRYVNLYIVKQWDGVTVPKPLDEIDLSGVNPLVAAPGTRMLRMPVQYACTNGANLQTIWRAPLRTGNYCVVVDLDENGKVSNGDIVDNVDKNGALRALGGFSVQ